MRYLPILFFALVASVFAQGPTANSLYLTVGRSAGNGTETKEVADPNADAWLYWNDATSLWTSMAFTDAIQDTWIDWGLSAGQISAADIPIEDSAGDITATDVEGALAELAAGGVGGGSTVDIDGVTVADPDFVSSGDIDFVNTSGTVTANINAGVIVLADLAAAIQTSLGLADTSIQPADIGTAAAADLIDDDTMATASATTVASSESIKAYVDTEVAGASGTGDSVLVDGVNTVDPDFVSTGDIDFVNTSNTITANINAGAVALADLAAAIQASLGLADTSLQPGDIGSTVQAYDLDLVDLADGTLSASKIDSAITRDTEWDTAAEINAATTDNDFLLDAADVIDDTHIDWTSVTIADFSGAQVSGAISWNFSSAASFTLPASGNAILESEILDDDTFATAAPTTVPSSESVKAYVDANIGSGDLSAADIDTFAELDALVADKTLVNEEDTFDLNINTLLLNEKASSSTVGAGDLELWAKSDAPTTLWFTDDTDTDYQVAALGLAQSWTAKQTFGPGATNAGLNVGSVAGDPSTPANGDLWYDSTANELTGRINGVNVALGAGGSFDGDLNGNDLVDTADNFVTVDDILDANVGIQVQNGATSGGFIEFYEASGGGSEKVTLKAADALGADATVTLPSSTGTLLLTNGDGSSLTNVPGTTGVYRNIWIDAGAMVPRTTNGPDTADITEEYATNDIMSDRWLFDSGATVEGAQFRIAMPDAWNLGTVKFKVYWDAATGASAADTVEWRIRARANGNADTIDAAWGTAVTLNDAVLTVGQVHQTAASAACTIGGTPALGDVCWFEIDRNGNGTDNMTEDAKLLGVMMQYQESTTEPSGW